MAAVKHARGLKLLLKVGDGASPETFTALCTVNSQRGIVFTSPTNEFPEIDCSDPDAISWLLREKVSLSGAFTGAGILNTPDVEDMFDWLVSPDSKNCQVVVDVPALDGGIIFEGAWHLTDFGITGDRGAKMEGNITLASDGEISKAANT
jgi:hypothetical protein